MDGVNYLVPVDARPEREVDVRFEDGDPRRPAGVESVAAPLRLVILDAYRNSLLARSVQRTSAAAVSRI